MKTSRFNIFIKESQRCYVYNTFSSMIMEVDKETWELLKMKEIPVNSKELINAKMIIQDEYDELKEIKKTYHTQQKKGRTLIITLALTLGCNFACPYCYENRDNRKISKEKQNMFIKFIGDQLKSNKFDNLFLTWFGGEPLLALSEINYLNERINELCLKYNINKLSFISTNAYLINERNIEFIKNLNLSDCYITIDGGKETHDKTRVLHNGEGTYDVIINNLKLLTKHNIPYSIRININKENQQNAKTLLKELKDLKVPYDRVFLGHIQSFTSSCKDCEKSLSKKEFANINHNFNCRTNQFNDLPCRRWTHCRAALNNNFVLDPQLNVYQCENDLGREEKRVGFIDLNGSLIKSKKNPYIEWDPFSFKKCLKCNCLPICLGGCLFMGIKDGKPQCRAEKYVLNKMIKRYIRDNSLKNKQK